MVPVRDERGGAIWGFLGAIGLVVVLMAIFFAACFNSASGTPAHRSLGRTEPIRHDRACDPNWDDCGRGSGNGNRGYDGEGGRSGDTNQRGDRNCRNICGNTVVIPDPRGDQPPPKDQQPASLTDPTKLPQAIQQIIKAGLDMGQLFADGTIKFVETMLTALA